MSNSFSVKGHKRRSPLTEAPVPLLGYWSERGAWMRQENGAEKGKGRFTELEDNKLDDIFFLTRVSDPAPIPGTAR
jgi:hypothetical protein